MGRRRSRSQIRTVPPIAIADELVITQAAVMQHLEILADARGRPPQRLIRLASRVVRGRR